MYVKGKKQPLKRNPGAPETKPSPILEGLGCIGGTFTRVDARLAGAPRFVARPVVSPAYFNSALMTNYKRCYFEDPVREPRAADASGDHNQESSKLQNMSWNSRVAREPPNAEEDGDPDNHVE
jgi:hypothetical protein